MFETILDFLIITGILFAVMALGYTTYRLCKLVFSFFKVLRAFFTKERQSVEIKVTIYNVQESKPQTTNKPDIHK